MTPPADDRNVPERPGGASPPPPGGMHSEGRAQTRRSQPSATQARRCAKDQAHNVTSGGAHGVGPRSSPWQMAIRRGPRSSPMHRRLAKDAADGTAIDMDQWWGATRASDPAEASLLHELVQESLCVGFATRAWTTSAPHIGVLQAKSINKSLPARRSARRRPRSSLRGRRAWKVYVALTWAGKDADQTVVSQRARFGGQILGVWILGLAFLKTRQNPKSK